MCRGSVDPKELSLSTYRCGPTVTSSCICSTTDVSKCATSSQGYDTDLDGTNHRLQVHHALLSDPLILVPVSKIATRGQAS
jgi:hypothetical protein